MVYSVDIYPSEDINPVIKDGVVDFNRGNSMGMNIFGQYGERIKYQFDIGTADADIKLSAAMNVRALQIAETSQ